MKKIKELIKQMTLEEKAALCTGETAWTTTPVERLGIPSMYVSDGPHGVRKETSGGGIVQKSLPATCFPTASCLSASWNTDLAHEMGRAMAEEAHALDVDVLLGPGVNIKRSPLCGRNFEYYSEDPFLAGELGASMIDGIQSEGVGTSIKHFAANNQEFQRFTIDAQVDERTLRELYFRPFEIAIKKARPWTVMCAYNKLNGQYCSEHHHLLADILKDEWGFEGLVVSDWGAVRDRVKSIQGGLDLEMPGPQDRRVQKLVDAVKSGECAMEDLDEAVRRILTIVFRAQAVHRSVALDVDAHHQLAKRIAEEGIVLLKNNGILPLKGQRRIAVIGNSAKEPNYQGGGSSHINPTRVDIPLDELIKRAGDSEIVFAQGYLATDTFDQNLLDEAVATAKSADVALLFLALPPSKESEGYDRQDLDLTEQQIALVLAVTAVQPNAVVILNSGSALVVQPWVDNVSAILQAWMMGQAGAGAVADVLFGNVNPGGKLAETFPLRLEDTPAYLNFPGEAGKVRYGEGMYVGYRYYDRKQMPVQFPFGYGLSYTTFDYQNAQTEATFVDVDGLKVSVDVSNTGNVAGSEIVQVYVRDHEARLDRPDKELKGFAKVFLAPGETKTVTIQLDFHSFAYYHPGYGAWITEDGDFDILIGASSQDIRHVLKTTIKSSLHLPCILNHESTVKEWMEDPRGFAALAPMIDEMKKQFDAFLGGEEGIGMDPMGFISDMPLPSVLMFQQQLLPMSVEELMEGFLQQAHNLDG